MADKYLNPDGLRQVKLYIDTSIDNVPDTFSEVFDTTGGVVSFNPGYSAGTGFLSDEIEQYVKDYVGAIENGSY